MISFFWLSPRLRRPGLAGPVVFFPGSGFHVSQGAALDDLAGKYPGLWRKVRIGQHRDDQLDRGRHDQVDRLVDGGQVDVDGFLPVDIAAIILEAARGIATV